ncbi:MAG: cation:proton antiporter, partial [Kiritimatiellae bacterium]|nr:cation:proton antiporter [Kiritimatiellia bacterium]
MSKRILSLLLAAVCVLTASGAWAGSVDAQASHIPREMASFLLLLGIIMVSARLGGLAFDRLRLPATLGELTAGVLLGPSLLGGVSLPGFPQGLHGVAARYLEPGGAMIGIVLCALMALLFLIGLETDVRLTRRQTPLSVWIGLGGSLGAMLLTAAAIHMGSRWLPDRAPALLSPTGLFLCAAAAFSSVGIAARSLAALRRLESPEGVGIMSAAAVDNLTGILLLTVATGYLTAMEGHAAGSAAVLGLVLRNLFLVAGAGVVSLTLARQIARAHKDLRHPAGAATFAIAIALLMAGIFGRSGLSALAGAYLAGLSLAGTDWRHDIQERMEIMHAAFVPACFTLLGMCLDLRLLLESETWLLAALFAAAAIVGKLVGCLGPARLAGFNSRGCLRVGLGLTPRGEMSLAVAAIGFFAGVLRGVDLAAVLLLLFVTGLAASPLLRLAFGGNRSGLRNAFQAQSARQLSFQFPSLTATKMILARLIDVLEEEGFHVQLLNRRSALYQLSKDQLVIGLHPEGTRMVVDCTAADQPLVNSAMIEVLAGIEHHLRELRRPLDAVNLARGMLRESQPRQAAGSSLKGLLSVNVLRPRLLADTKAAAITELIEML